MHFLTFICYSIIQNTILYGFEAIPHVRHQSKVHFFFLYLCNFLQLQIDSEDIKKDIKFRGSELLTGSVCCLILSYFSRPIFRVFAAASSTAGLSRVFLWSLFVI